MPSPPRTKWLWNQIGSANKRSSKQSTKKKPRKIEPRSSILQSSKWAGVRQLKACQMNRRHPSNVHPLPKLQECRYGSTWACASIKGTGFPQYRLCTRYGRSPVRWPFPICQFQHSKQLHSLCLPWARATLGLSSNQLPHLSTDPDPRSENLFEEILGTS